MRHDKPVRILLALILALVLNASCRRAKKPGEPGDFVRLMNLGKAHIENRESAQAVEILTRAVALQPDSLPARRNLARAYLITKKRQDAQAAVDQLLEALKLDSNSAGCQYLMALAHNRRETHAESLPYLEAAARLDPETAAIRYQLGRCFEANGQSERAHEQYLETIRLDPMNRFAYYRLAAQARARGDADAVRRYTMEFQRLKTLFGDQPESVLEQCVHTQPESAPVAGPGVRPAPPAIQVRFVDSTDQVLPETADRAVSVAAVIDIQPDGRPVLFVAGPDGRAALMSVNAQGRFDRTDLDVELAGRGPFSACAAGDFHSDVDPKQKFAAKKDVLNDIFLIGPGGAALLLQTGPGQFQDVTESAGLDGARGLAARWVDYDHDGDLDLLMAGATGLALYQNNGDKTATDVTAKVGLTGTGPAVDVIGVDLDADVATDVIVACGDRPTRVFMGQRTGQFAALPEPPGPWPACRGLRVNDLDNDGALEVALVADDRVRILADSGAPKAQFELGEHRPARAAWIDFDNDGWLDLSLIGAGGSVSLWRNLGGSAFEDVSAQIGLTEMTGPDLRDAVVADFDADGDSDLLLITADDGLRYLRNDGGNAGGQLKVRLVSVLTNPTGLGTRLEWRDGPRFVTRSVTELPIEIGTGSSRRLDTLRAVWSNGVVDNVLDVAVSNRPYRFVERVVEAGSCGFLFAWDGQRQRFVTDILGNAPLGLSIRRGVPLAADADEFVYIGGSGDLVPRDGRYQLEMAECYREILYVDEVKLVAVDHDERAEVHSTDKLTAPPFGPSQLWTLASIQTPRQVTDDTGRDVTSALLATDGVFTSPGRPTVYRGMRQPTSLTLAFGPVDRDNCVLALTGWLRYGSASVNIAMSQDTALQVIPPRLEALDATGQWVPLDVTVGMPAGKTKTILCDLSGRLPQDDLTLRLTTTFEIRWDRLAVGRRVDAASATGSALHTLGPVGARMHWLGFPRMSSRGPDHPIVPDFADRADRPAWRTTPQGWCTRYGDVLELLSDRDAKLAILNAGDSVTLSFDAAGLPPVGPGQTRSFFFYSVGWDRDGDHNVMGGDQVLPLPIEPTSMDTGPDPSATEPLADWRTRYNTRWVPGDRFRN
ncbi:MAG: FG-GAP-like repeat-containing protein [Phycisphaerae bacterium]